MFTSGILSDSNKPWTILTNLYSTTLQFISLRAMVITLKVVHIPLWIGHDK